MKEKLVLLLQQGMIMEGKNGTPVSKGGISKGNSGSSAAI